MKKEQEELIIDGEETQEVEAAVTYDIATYPSDPTLQGIVDSWNNKEIIIPDFQREFVWSKKQSSLLIESFLLGLPVPPVFFYIDEKSKQLVIDGQQRLLSIIFYFEGFWGHETIQGKRKVFRLDELDENSRYYNKSFVDLNEADNRKLRNAVLRVLNIRQLSPKGNTSIYHIFERLNTLGTPLKPQEIRNCVFRGNFAEILKKLNKEKKWRSILGKDTFDRHQKDIELVLRLFALSRKNVKYTKPMKEYLNNAMLDNRDGTTNGVKHFEKSFHEIVNIICEKLDEKPFHIRGPLNVAVLDSVFCVLLENKSKITKDLNNCYKQLLKDKEYFENTIKSTSDEAVIASRFKLAKKYLIK